jgi:hypothetical protein
MTTASLSLLAQQAQAAYAALSAAQSLDALAASLVGQSDAAFTSTQATNFAAEQSVVLQYNDDTSPGGQGTSLSVDSDGLGSVYCRGATLAGANGRLAQALDNRQVFEALVGVGGRTLWVTA